MFIGITPSLIFPLGRNMSWAYQIYIKLYRPINLTEVIRIYIELMESLEYEEDPISVFVRSDTFLASYCPRDMSKIGDHTDMHCPGSDFVAIGYITDDTNIEILTL